MTQLVLVVREDGSWHIEPATTDPNVEGGLLDETCVTTILVSDLEAAIAEARGKQ